MYAWWNSHKALAHSLAGVGAAIGATWAASSDFRAAVENALHTAPHWMQAIAGFAPFAVLIYTNFKKGQQ
jgi:hypothetical protein